MFKNISHPQKWQFNTKKAAIYKSFLFYINQLALPDFICFVKCVGLTPFFYICQDF